MLREAIIRWLRLDERYQPEQMTPETSAKLFDEMHRTSVAAYDAVFPPTGIKGKGSLTDEIEESVARRFDPSVGPSSESLKELSQLLADTPNLSSSSTSGNLGSARRAGGTI